MIYHHTVSGLSNVKSTFNYPYQFDSHVNIYWEYIIDMTEANSVAHTLGTYY